MNEAPIFLPVPRVTDDLDEDQRPTVPNPLPIPAARSMLRRATPASFFLVTPDGPVDGWTERDTLVEHDWWQSQRRRRLARWVMVTVIAGVGLLALAMLRR